MNPNKKLRNIITLVILIVSSYALVVHFYDKHIYKQNIISEQKKRDSVEILRDSLLKLYFSELNDTNFLLSNKNDSEYLQASAEISELKSSSTSQLIKLNGDRGYSVMVLRSYYGFVVDKVNNRIEGAKVSLIRKRGSIIFMNGVTFKDGNFPLFSNNMDYLIGSEPDTFFVIATIGSHIDTTDAIFQCDRYNHLKISWKGFVTSDTIIRK